MQLSAHVALGANDLLDVSGATKVLVKWARTGASLALEVRSAAAIAIDSLGLQRLDYLRQLAASIA